MSTESQVPSGGYRRAQPESFRGRTLSASLTVDDLDSSLRWYEDVVGFTVGEKYERDGVVQSVSLRAGAVEIMITRDDGAKGRDRIKGQGISLYITTVQDLDELAKRIKDRGGALVAEPADMPWGARVMRVKDPDGFTFAISSDV